MMSPRMANDIAVAISAMQLAVNRRDSIHEHVGPPRWIENADRG